MPFLLCGRRIGKNADGENTKYVYAGDMLIREEISDENNIVYLGDDLIAGNNATEGDGIVVDSVNKSVLEYIYGLNGVAGLVYNGVNYYFRRNVQGDITRIYSIDGTLAACYTYDAWGNHKVYDPNGNENVDPNFVGNVNPFRYRGYYYDSETGLYYCGSRYYDPEVGRWINADDISYLDPETINGLNLYSYCGNNPVMNVDPNGNFFLSFLIGLVIASVTFAVVNTGIQLVSDVINYAATGKWNSGWEDYVGAFIGGLAGGATFFLTKGNLAATFAVMGGLETLSTNLLTNATGKTNYSGLQIVGHTALSFGLGWVVGSFGGGKMGITTGRNSYLAVWKSGLTRLRNNTGGMSTKTMLKGLASISFLKRKAGLIRGSLNSLIDWFNYLLGDRESIGYVLG